MTKIAGSGSASRSESNSQRHGSADPDPHGSADPDPDPDPHQNVMDPQHWFVLILRVGCRQYCLRQHWVQVQHAGGGPAHGADGPCGRLRVHQQVLQLPQVPAGPGPRGHFSGDLFSYHL